MTLTTNVGTTYAVRSAVNCTITTEEGDIVLKVSADTPCAFIATSATVTCDNDEAIIVPTFKKALVTQDIDEGAIAEAVGNIAYLPWVYGDAVTTYVETSDSSVFSSGVTQITWDAADWNADNSVELLGKIGIYSRVDETPSIKLETSTDGETWQSVSDEIPCISSELAIEDSSRMGDIYLLSYVMPSPLDAAGKHLRITGNFELVLYYYSTSLGAQSGILTNIGAHNTGARVCAEFTSLRNIVSYVDESVDEHASDTIAHLNADEHASLTTLLNANFATSGQLPLRSIASTQGSNILESGYCYTCMALTDFWFQNTTFGDHSTSELHYCQLVIEVIEHSSLSTDTAWNPDWVWLNDCPALTGEKSYFFHLMNYDGTTYIYHMGGSSNSVDLTTLMEGTVYSADEDAATNSNFTTAIIDGSRIPKGTYTAIELPQRIGYSVYISSEPLYLIIQEATGVDNNGEDVYTTLAVSDNANTPAYASSATTARWEFSDGFTLSGGNIKIIPSNTTEIPSDYHCFGGRCISTGITGDSILEYNTRREQWRLCARFEGSYETTIYTPIEHSQDNNIHLSEMEQALIGNACRVINYEAVELVDDEIAISIDATTVPDYQLAELTELTVTGISIIGASSTTVATAAFWLTTGETAPSITWAEAAIWIDGTSVGSAPTLEADTKYRFAVSQEPDGQIIISLDYSYPYEQTT